MANWGELHHDITTVKAAALGLIFKDVDELHQRVEESRAAFHVDSENLKFLADAIETIATRVREELDITGKEIRRLEDQVALLKAMAAVAKANRPLLRIVAERFDWCEPAEKPLLDQVGILKKRIKELRQAPQTGESNGVGK